jgi:glycosyltransferase involved in cell wall biosynthesis
MRVLVVSCVFPPEPVISAQTSAQIAEELARRGDEVTVITAFPSRPAGKLFSGYSRRLFERRMTTEGFELVRCFSMLSAESHFVSRLLENFSFGLTGGWAALTARRPDVIYANTWPIVAQAILSAIAQLRNIPLVISVQDVYPESLEVQQRIPVGGWLARWMRWLDSLIARRARAVVVISERFATTYQRERGVVADHLHVVPNWVDSRSVPWDEDRALQFRVEKNIPPGAFVCVYGGNIGAAAGVETLVRAFHYLKSLENVYLVIAGEGSHLKACQALADEVGNRRLLFHTPWRSDETARLLHAADVLLLPTRGRQSLASVPSKLITYLLAARPVIALALPQSDLAALIERSGSGWIVEPDRPEVLAATIETAMKLEVTERVRRGRAGREFALRNMMREACLPRLIHILHQAATPEGKAGT